VGNPTAVNNLRKWAQAWQAGSSPKQRALILAGDPGIGKTTAAHALAHDFHWSVIELNASDARNAAAIEKVALRGALYDSFGADGSFQQASKGARKLIILDEADSLVERVQGGRKLDKDLSDRGGKPAIVRTLRQTGQPIILIVNDLYSLTKGSGGPLRTLAQTVRFQKLRQPTVKAILQKVCQAEGVETEPAALDELAANAGGDLRAALNDLQGLAEAGPVTLDRVRWLGSRDKQKEMFELLAVIFRSMDYPTPRRTAMDVDENPESITLWVDDNLPIAYDDPYDLQRGYEALSRAALCLGRVRRRQYYGLWSYASELSTSGVALAKKRPPTHRPRYQFPSWLRRMSSSRGRRAVRNNALSAMARHCHTSRTTALTEMRPLFNTLLSLPLVTPRQTGDDVEEGDDMEPEAPAVEPSFQPGPRIVADLKLEAPELAYLLGTKPEDPHVKALLEAARPLGWGPVEKLRGQAAKEALQGALSLPAKPKGKTKGKKGKAGKADSTSGKAKGKTKGKGQSKGTGKSKGQAETQDDKDSRDDDSGSDASDPDGEATPDEEAEQDRAPDPSQKTLFEF